MSKPRVISVESQSDGYNVYIYDGYDGLCSAFDESGLSGRNVFIVTDHNVRSLYLDSFVYSISKTVNIKGFYAINPDEQSKSFETAFSVYNAFIDNHADRKTVIIALGGGVVGDVCGFCASTFMRGLPFVQIPTTLLAMTDSSIGGKTGIDFRGLKNVVGSFYNPEFIYINSEVLNTLPSEQFSTGLAEVIKYGLIRDEGFYRFLSDKKSLIAGRDKDVIKQLISRSVEIKSEIVSIDEKEAGLREILNFGHTFGHSIESLSGYSVPHGFCVSVGMTAALHLSAVKGYLSREIVEDYISLCKELSLPVKLSDIPIVLNSEDIYSNMIGDKKSRNGKIRLVLLRQVGEAFTDEDCGKKEILESIDFIIK